MTTTRVMIEIGMPDKAPEQSQKPDVHRIPLEDRVRDMLECIESGYDSGVEWLTVNKLYTTLLARKDKDRNPRVKSLIEMIKPVLAKYGYHGVATNVRETSDLGR